MGGIVATALAVRLLAAGWAAMFVWPSLTLGAIGIMVLLFLRTDRVVSAKP